MIEPLIARLDSTVTRLGTVLEPSGDPAEAEGVLNPACTRTREGELLLYPRMVGAGNVSEIGIVRVVEHGDHRESERIGLALAPLEPYELRAAPGGYGCEDPRVTFLPALDRFVMSYTAFGPAGPRIALALSRDGYEWTRLGLLDFSRPGLPAGDDKDAAFFPEPVHSPSGVLSFALYHRPMLHISSVDGHSAIPIILGMSPRDRESVRIAYIPVEAALADQRNLLRVNESELVLAPDGHWGRIKVGGGTPPVRVAEGWLSLYHGVDAIDHHGRTTMVYSAGIVIHDADEPHRLRYHSPRPILKPATHAERTGIVNNVVFPTGIDPRKERSFDTYYGMADAKIGCARLDLGAATLAVEPAA
jgi:predicted GH43/DUF377 family glycosyl hydrolase